jgi:hypothetical protein
MREIGAVEPDVFLIREQAATGVHTLSSGTLAMVEATADHFGVALLHEDLDPGRLAVVPPGVFEGTEPYPAMATPCVLTTRDELATSADPARVRAAIDEVRSTMEVRW